MLVYDEKEQMVRKKQKLFRKYQLIGKLSITAKTCAKRNKEISTKKEKHGAQHWNKGRDGASRRVSCRLAAPLPPARPSNTASY